MQAVLNDYRTAPIDEKLRAMLGLLETFTLHPDQLSASGVRAVLATGVTREAIRDAFYVAFLFNTYDRLADTLGWELPDQRYYAKAGQFLLKKGYRSLDRRGPNCRNCRITRKSANYANLLHARNDSPRAITKNSLSCDGARRPSCAWSRFA